jgi:Carboxypeptidase regulatory-like domain
MRKFLRVFCVLALSIGCLACVASAQQTSGVSGVVIDDTGGVVAGVTVAMDNAKLGIHTSTTTNDVGYYQFLKLTPSEGYELSFTKDGFRKLVLSNVTLGISIVETRNVALELGSVTQSVEVQASGEATLNTSDASVGNVISTRSIEDLPIQFRLDAANLMQLQAGVNDAGSITGARSDQGNITLDGMDINDQATGQAFTSTIPVSIDALQEVRTVTAGETADFGRSSGGMINLGTKSGGNAWHGNLREYNRNTDFAANDWFANRDGVPRAALIRNQFGGNLLGPIKKDKLFFFFDYEGLRRASSQQIERAVPTASFLAGNLAYINSSIDPATGQTCSPNSRINRNPSCISFLTPSDIATLDPQHVGVDPDILSMFTSRPYPAPNDPTGGDGLNSQGFRFTAPAHETDNLYTARIDYNLSDKHKFFFSGNVAREGVDDDFNTSIVQFPGDTAPNSRDVFNSYRFTVGWTWTPSANVTNQVSAGLVRAILSFPSLANPTYPNQFGFSGPFSSPYLSSSSQSRNVPVPEFREGLTWTKGKHTMDFGTDVKLIRQIIALKNDFNFVTVGLGGANLSLDTAGDVLRPSDLNGDPSAVSAYDNAFPFILGRYADVFSNFNYNKSGQVFTNGTGKNRDYNYNEFEFYFQDSWKVRSDLTLIYGLRYSLHTTPYEVNGFQSVPSVNEDVYFGTRVQNALNGVSGFSAVPLVSYNLGGSANGKRGYYDNDFKDLGPRLALAYNPDFRSGLLNSVFGDRKSTIRAGAAVLYDRIGGGASFGLDQNTYLFDSSADNPFGAQGDPVGALLSDPRFHGFNSLPTSGFFPTPPNATPPTTPNTLPDGTPIGTSAGGFPPSFFQFDQHAKSPYAILLNFGFQRELPGNFLLEANYVARLGRRLLAVGDAATITNFKDPTSGQFLRQAFGQLQNELAQGSIAPIPWFENQINQDLASKFGSGTTCADFGFVNCVDLTQQSFGTLISKGDLSDTIAGLASVGGVSLGGILDPNVGLPAQTAANGYIGNYANSNYNALLVSIRKRLSAGLQFDFNYTYSHSIDNMSSITNSYVTYTGGGTGLVCELDNLRICRASSDFDARHTISANYVYDLPFGRDRHFGRNSSKVLDAVIGGWVWSGIVTWRTGYPFSASTGSFPTAFTLDAPAVLTGSLSDLSAHLHTDSSGSLQYFKDVNTTLNALSFPFAGAVGNRNVFRGPGFSNIDMGVGKVFHLPWGEGQTLKFQWDSFNAFNHPVFNGPSSASLSSLGNFGEVTSTANAPRVMQVSLRYSF